MDALRVIEAGGVASVEVRPEVQAADNEELQHKLSTTVWNSGGCRSWYLDKRGRNTTLWPSFTFRFIARTRRFTARDYALAPRHAPQREPPALAY